MDEFYMVNLPADNDTEEVTVKTAGNNNELVLIVAASKAVVNVADLKTAIQKVENFLGRSGPTMRSGAPESTKDEIF